MPNNVLCEWKIPFGDRWLHNISWIRKWTDPRVESTHDAIQLILHNSLAVHCIYGVYGLTFEEYNRHTIHRKNKFISHVTHTKSHLRISKLDINNKTKECTMQSGNQNPAIAHITHKHFMCGFHSHFCTQMYSMITSCMNGENNSEHHHHHHHDSRICSLAFLLLLLLILLFYFEYCLSSSFFFLLFSLHFCIGFGDFFCLCML